MLTYGECTNMTATHHQQPSNRLQSSEPLQLAQSKQELASSPTLAMNEAVAARRAAGHDNIIHLGFGEASFPLHPLLAEALARAARNTGYAPVLGLPRLREAIADYLEKYPRTCGWVGPSPAR